MSRRNKITPSGAPGLFDDLDFEKSFSDLPIHPSIARHAERVSLSGGAKETKQEVSDIATPLATTEHDKLMFISFGSGSSGNCSFIGDTDGGFLIDAGVDIEKVIAELKKHNIPMSAIHGICITHDHRDHTHYAYAFARKYRNIPIYCTPRALNGLLRRHNTSRRIKDYHHPIYKEIPFTIGNFTITAFEVMHDGTDNAGFHIAHKAGTFVVATDLGCISERADFYLRQANYLMLEANYDAQMLANGPYPEYLKARIADTNGHLDNAITAKFIAESYTSELKYVFLCHLSNENNTPEQALATVSKALSARNITIGTGCDTPSDREAMLQLVALPRFESSMLYIFRRP